MEMTKSTTRVAVNAQAGQAGRSWRRWALERGPEISLIVLCLAFSGVSDTFLSIRNLLNVLDQITVIGIMALGMTAVIVIGGIDLSVGSVLALSMMVMGWLANVHGVPMPIAMAAALAVGASCGAVSGLLVTWANLPPFIATLAMMSVARGLANLVTDGQQIVGYPEWFDALSTTRYFGVLSPTVAALIALILLAGAFLSYRPTGRALFAIGGGAEVARLAGIKVKSITGWVYVASGALCGLAGIVMSTRLDSSQPSGALGYELDTIAAVVLGGASLRGGTGSVKRTVVGVLIIGILRNGLNLTGMSPFVQQIVIGAVIALAVAVDANKRKTR